MTAVTLEDVNNRLHTVVIVEQADENFSVLGECPDWFEQLLPAGAGPESFRLQDALLFFDTFMDHVKERLGSNPEALVSSGPWSESDRSGQEQNLSAIAMEVRGTTVLQIKVIEASQMYHQSIFQKAREYSLNFERLSRERERKEVLLHTIVHDLAGPLTAILGSLELIKLRQEGPNRLVGIAISQCKRQNELINTILSSFSAEHHTFDPANITRETAPNVNLVLTQAHAAFQPAFENQKVTLDLSLPDDHDYRAIGEPDLLERVLSNLLQNALRYSPPGSTTVLELKVSRYWLNISVCDEGEGISADITGTLFDQFAGGGPEGGKLGLGLYFCKITVERWGGSISHAPNVQSSTGQPGTRMTIQLPRLRSDG